MLLTEAEAKARFYEHGMPIPTAVQVGIGSSVGSPTFHGPWYLKAQIPEGGRGKRGLVQRCVDTTDLVEADRRISELAGPVDRLLEQAVPCLAERYLSIGVDGASFGPVLHLGDAGGVDVESLAVRSGWARMPIDVRRGLLPHDVFGAIRTLSLLDDEARSLVDAALRLWEVFREADTDLVEINPLGWDGTRHVALDGKLRTFDAIDRRRVTYFERSGSVAVLSGGAGLGMAVADMLTGLGTPPANFIDVAGGVTPEALREMATIVFSRTMDSTVHSLLMAMSTSLTPLDGVLRVVLEVASEYPPHTPAVAYFASGAARSDEGPLLEALRCSGVEVKETLEDAVRRASALAGR